MRLQQKFFAAPLMRPLVFFWISLGLCAIPANVALGQEEAELSIDALRACATAGVGECQHKLAKRLELGMGVERDVAAAKRWYEDAYRSGYEPAGNDLLRITRQQPVVTPKSPAKAAGAPAAPVPANGATPDTPARSAPRQTSDYWQSAAESTKASGAIMTGAKLWGYCTRLQRIRMLSGGKSAPKLDQQLLLDATLGQRCEAYISGFIENTELHGPTGHQLFCWNGEASKDLSALVIRWIENNRSCREAPAAICVAAALSDAYPCDGGA